MPNYRNPDADAPRIRKRGGINTGTGDRSNRIGYHGEIPAMGLYGFAKPVRRAAHWLRNLDAYAISSDAIEVLRRIHTAEEGIDPVMVILFIEEDTGRVYEYDADLFFSPDSHGSKANEVPDSMLHDPTDPQVYAATKAATEWPEFSKEVWIHDEHTGLGNDYAPGFDADEKTEPAKAEVGFKTALTDFERESGE